MTLKSLPQETLRYAIESPEFTVHVKNDRIHITGDLTKLFNARNKPQKK